VTSAQEEAIRDMAGKALSEANVNVLSFHVSFGGSDPAQFAVDAFNHMLALNANGRDATVHMDIAHIPVASIDLP
jgi:hypothetical protein